MGVRFTKAVAILIAALFLATLVGGSYLSYTAASARNRFDTVTCSNQKYVLHTVDRLTVAASALVAGDEGTPPPLKDAFLKEFNETHQELAERATALKEECGDE